MLVKISNKCFKEVSITRHNKVPYELNEYFDISRESETAEVKQQATKLEQHVIKMKRSENTIRVSGKAADEGRKDAINFLWKDKCGRNLGLIYIFHIAPDVIYFFIPLRQTTLQNANRTIACEYKVQEI